MGLLVREKYLVGFVERHRLYMYAVDVIAVEHKYIRVPRSQFVKEVAGLIPKYLSNYCDSYCIDSMCAHPRYWRWPNFFFI